MFKESPTTNYLENFLVDLSTSQESSQYCFPKKTLIGYIAFYSQIPGTYKCTFEFHFHLSPVQEVLFS